MNFEKLEKKTFIRRSNTRTMSIKKVSPQEFLEDGRSIYEMLRGYRNGAKFKKEVMKVLIN